MTKPMYAIGYARVSTPKQAVEGESLESQATSIKRFIEAQGWQTFPEDTVFQEPFTGTTSNRPIYNSIIGIIKAHPGKIKYFVIKVIDRLSREGASAYEGMKKDLMRLGVELRDVSGIIQPSVNTLGELDEEYEWSRTSPSQLGELVVAESSKNERTAILTRLISAQIRLTRQGYKVGRPVDGFINKRVFVEDKKKIIQVPDPDRAHFFIEMFKMRAEGVYSDQEIVDKVNALGYSSKTQKRWNKSKNKVVGKEGDKKLTIKQLQRIIPRLTYCGVICEKWTKHQPIKAQYDGLVTVELFNAANRGKVHVEIDGMRNVEVLYNHYPEKNIRKRHKFNLRFPYKNVAMCATCRRPLLASPSRSKSGKQYSFYHCARNHKRYAIPQTTLDTAFSDYLSKIKFTDEFLSDFEKVLILKYRKEEGHSAKLTAVANDKVAELEHRKAELIESFGKAHTDTMRREIEAKVEKLEEEINMARKERNNLEVKEDDIHEFIAYAKTLMEHPTIILKNIVNMREQLALYSLFFEEFPTYEEIVSRTPKLTLVFKVNNEITDSKSHSVTLQRIEL